MGRRLMPLPQSRSSARRTIHKWGNPVRIARRAGDRPGPAEPATIAAERSEAKCPLRVAFCNRQQPSIGGPAG